MVVIKKLVTDLHSTRKEDMRGRRALVTSSIKLPRRAQIGVKLAQK